MTVSTIILPLILSTCLDLVITMSDIMSTVLVTVTINYSFNSFHLFRSGYHHVGHNLYRSGLRERLCGAVGGETFVHREHAGEREREQCVVSTWIRSLASLFELKARVWVKLVFPLRQYQLNSNLLLNILVVNPHNFRATKTGKLERSHDKQRGWLNKRVLTLSLQFTRAQFFRLPRPLP